MNAFMPMNLTPMKSISIIIPLYTRDEKTIFPRLFTIDNQILIDFSKVEIIIIDDCSPVILPDQFFRQFRNIRPIYKRLEKNIGPSMARQIGLEMAKNELVLFHDADDTLLSFESLYHMTLDTDDSDVIYHNFICEGEKFPDYKIVMRGRYFNPLAWLHAALFRRQWLLDNAIGFSDDPLLAKAAEDFFFNCFCMTHDPRIIMKDISTYIWRYNKNSITRSSDYITKNGRYLNFHAWIQAFEKNPHRRLINYVFVVIAVDCIESKDNNMVYLLAVFAKKFDHYFYPAGSDKLAKTYKKLCEGSSVTITELGEFIARIRRIKLVVKPPNSEGTNE